MGGEIAQWNEWYSKVELEWYLLRYPTHQGVQHMVKEINQFYLQHPAFWERDVDYSGFEWVDFSDTRNSVISYLRLGGGERFLCVHNFTPNYHENYRIHLKGVTAINERFNSDEQRFGGSGKKTLSPEIVRNDQREAVAVTIKLAPLATMIFQVN